MTRRAAGVVKNGRIELLSPIDWPEGAQVVIEPWPEYGLPDIDGWEPPVPAEVSANGQPGDFMEEPEVKAAREAVKQHTLGAVRRKMGME